MFQICRGLLRKSNERVSNDMAKQSGANVSLTQTQTEQLFN